MNIETYSLRNNIDIELVPIHDAGDLHVVDDAAETLRRLGLVTKDILDAGKMPVTMGGEHTISLGIVRSLSKSTGIISLDAHGDLRDEYGGGKLSHATVLRRISEVVGVDSILVCGVRALCREEVELIEKNNIHNMTTWEMRELGAIKVSQKISEFCRRFSQIYLTIDIDALDPAYAPGVGNPESDGISPADLLTVAYAAAKERLVGFDLVEVSPNYDTGVTAAVAARIMFEIIATIEAFKNR
jgi:agmatinase